MTALARPPRVAIAACRGEDGRTVYPDEDWPLLEPALAERGAVASQVAWDDAEVDWAGYDAVVVRSTWDSVDRAAEYLDWVDAVEAATALHNPAAVLRWNLDKRHLRDLEAEGLPTVPTEWVAPDDSWEPPSWPFVIKPVVSAGGRDTARYEANESGEAQRHLQRLQAEGRNAMVQPYMADVDAAGEVKMVYIAGVFSHAVRVGALLQPGAGVLDRPWEIPLTREACAPSDAQRRLGDVVIDAVTSRFGAGLVYGRVDVVGDDVAGPAILEVELIDPMLTLWASPGAPDRLAAAIVAAAERARR